MDGRWQFWGVYQQEQYIANNFNRVSRQREIKATVLYPAEVFDDDDIDETRTWYRNDKVSFLRGWNFCTDLYRLIEHVDSTNREVNTMNSASGPGSVITSFLSRLKTPAHFASDTLALISSMHRELPPELKKVRAMTGDLDTDRFGFIASNILVTTQTLKMQLIGPERSSVHQRCAIVSELLDELSTIPVAYFHASNTCSLHHVAHIGHLLGNIVQKPLSPWAYHQVRNLLLVLASFLDRIGADRPTSVGLSAKIRAHVSRIDQMRQDSTRQGIPGSSTTSSNLPLGHSALGSNWGAGAATAQDTSLQDVPTSLVAPLIRSPTYASGGADNTPGPQLPDQNYLSMMDIVQQLDFASMGTGNPGNGQDVLLNQPLEILEPSGLGQQSNDFFDSWPF
ncbi:unnamed protein product [Clonostachys rosea]|uniref:Transcription factor domain-containing protein n=1 Tax=Bionectria ochroleuca TaxID=29856 RepID=A0ABY6U7X9_BIOOC|nr:unnamed protein product [Clonostachys rosea]